MTILGWTMVALMLSVIWHKLLVPHKATAALGKNAPLIAAIIAVNLMSALDALSTLYLVACNHSREMNPVMSALIERGYLLFFAVKVSITMAATLACWYYYERTRKAKSILNLSYRLYRVLMAWHCLLLSSVLL
jgi:uncharacterized protein DUF5658